MWWCRCWQYPYFHFLKSKVLPADLSLLCLLMCCKKKSFDKMQYSHFCLLLLQAAGRHQCSYLISLQKQEFLLQGGDHTWLKGLSRIPQKLRDLYEINKILAHRPWLLTKSHIEVKQYTQHSFYTLVVFLKKWA